MDDHVWNRIRLTLDELMEGVVERADAKLKDGTKVVGYRVGKIIRIIITPAEDKVPF